MKKIIPFLIAIISLIGSQPLQAQIRHSYGFYMMAYDQSAEQVVNKKNKIAQRTIVTSRPRTVKTAVQKYDNNGRVILYDSGKNKVITSYYENDQKRNITIYKKNKLVERDSFLYDGKKFLAAFYYNKDNKLCAQENYAYSGDSSLMTEYKLMKLKRGALTEKTKQVFEYYPDGSYKKISFYKNGKIDYYSLFDCNPVGENHKKDSLHNCVKYDVDSLGNKMKITILNNKKWSTKTIEYFNQKDQLIAQKRYDLKKNRIETEIHYVPGQFFYNTYIFYRKGKENYRRENVYDAQLNCTTSNSFVKKKLKFITKNTYNERGLLQTSVERNMHDKKKQATSYQYSYF
ncbi:MAG: hypothetical protein JWP12_601 [Bacteroidetes bacterium]|nr:hypothetical protein [Bacteroidota bacterium]